jgi:hypothetical protein
MPQPQPQAAGHGATNEIRDHRHGILPRMNATVKRQDEHG